MRRFVAGLLLVGLLASCGQADQVTTEESAPSVAGGEAYGGAEMASRGIAAPAPPPATAPAEPNAAPADADQSANGPSPTQPQQPGGGTNSPVLYLAYAYQMGFEIPSERLAGVMDRHLQACQQAGPRLCQLIGSNRSGDPESYIEGYASIRGEPQWLRTFMGGMSAEVDAAGGRIIQETTNTEDLTRQIVDTEARQRALTALRDRLQALLRSRPGRLADLLEVERELARVQGEIDAIQSNLAVMRTRVSMSELTLSYRSAPRPVGSDTLEPLRQAFANFIGIIVSGFAAILTIIAALIPFAVVIVPMIWFALRWRKRRGGRFLRREAHDEAPPPTPGASSPG